MIALDASALLALLFREAGHATVGAYLPESCLTTVNFSEVMGRFARDGHDVQQVWQKINASPIKIIPFSEQQAVIAAALLPYTKSFGLSLADRACLSLAVDRGIPVITADRVWLELEIDIDIRVIR